MQEQKYVKCLTCGAIDKPYYNAETKLFECVHCEGRIEDQQCKIIHKWQLFKKTEVYKYYFCKKCPKRKTVLIHQRGYEPILKGFPHP